MKTETFTRETWQTARKLANANGYAVHTDAQGRDFVQRKDTREIVSPAFDGDYAREDAWIFAATLPPTT